VFTDICVFPLMLHCLYTAAPHSVSAHLYAPSFFLGSFEPIKSIYDQNFNLIYVFFPLSWCLMRLSMVQLVLVNLKSFYPMAGYDLLGKLSKTPHTHCSALTCGMEQSAALFPSARLRSSNDLVPTPNRSACGVSSVPRCAEDAAAMGAGAAEEAGDLRGPAFQVHLHPPQG